MRANQVLVNLPAFITYSTRIDSSMEIHRNATLMPVGLSSVATVYDFVIAFSPKLGSPPSKSLFFCSLPFLPVVRLSRGSRDRSPSTNYSSSPISLFMNSHRTTTYSTAQAHALILQHVYYYNTAHRNKRAKAAGCFLNVPLWSL